MLIYLSDVAKGSVLKAYPKAIVAELDGWGDCYSIETRDIRKEAERADRRAVLWVGIVP